MRREASCPACPAARHAAQRPGFLPGKLYCPPPILAASQPWACATARGTLALVRMRMLHPTPARGSCCPPHGALPPLPLRALTPPWLPPSSYPMLPLACAAGGPLRRMPSPDDVLPHPWLTADAHTATAPPTRSRCPATPHTPHPTPWPPAQPNSSLHGRQSPGSRYAHTPHAAGRVTTATPATTTMADTWGAHGSRVPLEERCQPRAAPPRPLQERLRGRTRAVPCAWLGAWHIWGRHAECAVPRQQANGGGACIGDTHCCHFWCHHTMQSSCISRIVAETC